ncbi:U7 snRNA-associated Sm-like protein LSm10 [Leptotrombidium deliense]|uniref:U7 snRNA-associated Sm-like protein LSm10 n=1 Tax=Leptotrombidium deliense TaxID=299467 RepID=A0A443SK39_9ACAR|nr:U7 snRNA-associated Sm-like protein LSm10 [Leptotrombidium deliense]
MQTPRERAQCAKTLICFLRSLVDERTRIELRDDTEIVGVVKSVDAYMNIELSDVTVEKHCSRSNSDLRCEKYDYLFLKGTKIRYVSIPDECDTIQAIGEQIESIRGYSKRMIDSMKAFWKQTWHSIETNV